jgi:hypothetical protein
LRILAIVVATDGYAHRQSNFRRITFGKSFVVGDRFPMLFSISCRFSRVLIGISVTYQSFRDYSLICDGIASVFAVFARSGKIVIVFLRTGAGYHDHDERLRFAHQIAAICSRLRGK